MIWKSFLSNLISCLAGLQKNLPKAAQAELNIIKYQACYEAALFSVAF